MAIDLNQPGEYQTELNTRKKRDKNKIISRITPTTQVIVDKKNYNIKYLKNKYRQLFQQEPNEKEIKFIKQNNLCKK